MEGFCCVLVARTSNGEHIPLVVFERMFQGVDYITENVGCKPERVAKVKEGVLSDCISISAADIVIFDSHAASRIVKSLMKSKSNAGQAFDKAYIARVEYGSMIVSRGSLKGVNL